MTIAKVRSTELACFLGGAVSAVAISQLIAGLLKRRSNANPTLGNAQPTEQGASASSLPPELEHELFSRVASFFGEEEGFAQLRGAFVVVVGLGGVGSHAAHMLARSGVGRIRVVDFDQVTLSSLNRHAVARLCDVGLPKAEVMAQRLREIVPCCHVEARTAIFTVEAAAELLEGSPSFVLDCIDDLATKADLLAACSERGLRVISSLGAALKADPTRLHIGELSNTKHEPLAVRLRYHLRKRGVSADGIMAIYSSERPRGEMLPLTDEQRQQPQEFGVLENFRIRVLPVLGTMPAIFGQSAAAFVLCELAGKPFVPCAVDGLSRAVKHRMLQHLQNRERASFGFMCEDLQYEDVEESIQEVWSCRCVKSGKRLGTAGTFALTRWDRSKPPTVSNLILLTAPLADKFDQEGRSMLDAATIKRIEDRLRLFDGI